VFTIESTLDDLARAGGVDPLAFGWRIWKTNARGR
jgi:hypothetical protein